MREFHLAANLRRIRSERGMTPAQLADACGMSPSTVYGMESGRTAMPRLETMTILADVLDCSVSELLGEVFESENSTLPVREAIHPDLVNDLYRAAAADMVGSLSAKARRSDDGEF